MNWKLIAQLSLFGLAMGVLTVFLIPSTIEPYCWLAVFIVSSWLIATRCDRAYFAHGVLTGMANSVWVTSAHVLLFRQYVARHPAEMASMASMPLSSHPRMLMAVIGPVIGVISGIVLGVFAVVAHKLTAPRARPAVT